MKSDLKDHFVQAGPDRASRRSTGIIAGSEGDVISYKERRMKKKLR